MSIINFRNVLHSIPPNLTDNLFKILNRILGTNFGINQWYLIYKLKDNSLSNKFRYLSPPKGTFWADPHVVKFREDYFVFFEEFNYKSSKGCISFLSIKSNGNVSEPERILETKYHLSYPFVFEHKGRFFMVPECSNSGKIQLYESFNFPYKWKPVKTLIDNINAVDSTLFNYDGMWWLFTSVKDVTLASPSNNLSIFYSKNLLSNNWIPHPFNPILSHDRSLRSAGNIFRIKGRVFRPSQNSYLNYGQGIHINEIVGLTKSSFKEKKVATLDSNNFKNILGLHTFSNSDEYFFLDCLKLRQNNPEKHK